MALAHFHERVLRIQRAGPQGLDVHKVADTAGLDRLAAAVDAAAGASHDLHEMIFGFAGFDLVQQSGCIFHAAGHSDLDEGAGHIVAGLLDAFDAADIHEIKLRQLFSVRISTTVRRQLP